MKPSKILVLIFVFFPMMVFEIVAAASRHVSRKLRRVRATPEREKCEADRTY
jgi:hypothetical protein